MRLSTVWRLLRERWRLLAVLTVLGALLGAGASFLFSEGYVSSSSVVLQGPREPDELRTEAQLAVSTVVLGRAAEALRLGVSGASLKASVSAGPDNGNVIKIQTHANTPKLAMRLADQVASEYVAYSSQLVSNSEDASAQVLREQQETLRRQVEQTNKKISELHDSIGTSGTTVESVQSRTQLEGLRSELSEAIKVLGESETASTRANMVVLGPAEPAHEGSPTRLQFIGGGALLLLLLGLLGHLATARMDRRLRHESDIAAALGATMLADIDLPDDSAAGYQVATAPVRGRAHRVLFGERPWNLPEPPAPGDEHGRAIRYRRVLGRLRGEPNGNLRVLVLVAEDDPAGHRAAVQLAVAAAANGSTSVITDDGGLTRLLEATKDRSGGVLGALAVRTCADPRPVTGRTVLHVVDFSASKPIVPDGETVCGVLVLITSATRTGWELANLASACTDAGHSILGTVIVRRTLPVQEAREAAPAVPADEDALAGSA